MNSLTPQTPHFGAFLFVLYTTGLDFCYRFILRCYAVVRCVSVRVGTSTVTQPLTRMISRLRRRFFSCAIRGGSE
jgi:hypothetical protein